MAEKSFWDNIFTGASNTNTDKNGGMTFGQTLVSGLINSAVTQGLSYLASEGKAEYEGEQLDRKYEEEMKLRQLIEQAAMERLQEELRVAKEKAILDSKSGLAQQALGGVPTAYRTAIEGILGGRAQQQSALQAIINAGQKAAMGSRSIS